MLPSGKDVLDNKRMQQTRPTSCSAGRPLAGARRVFIYGLAVDAWCYAKARQYGESLATADRSKHECLRLRAMSACVA